MPTSNASAVWEGVLKNGRGHFKAGSGAFEGDFSFATRFEGARGTNPEELIAAAHAACLSMALSAGLEKSGTPATRISTKASCTVEKAGEGFKITRMRLEVRGKVPGVDQAGFVQAAEAAKNGCPVSTALQGNVQFELDARLEEMEPVRSGR
jgi:lipoyl-dependent peroxiredoxin